MTAWWNELSQRERMLIMLASALLAILAVSLFVVRPLADWRGNASVRAEQARDSYDLVVSAAATVNNNVEPSPQYSMPVRQAITTSASAAGLELIRIGAEESGQIEVQPEVMDGEKLYQWLANLERGYGISVDFADIARADDGGVNAQVLVFGRK